ncbi:hypothetical protein FB451DRAFT_1172263 [Mycena latifolia]|nr:hypothetical protein FB451DRAFT_1172263 [Mycena latifolia]
MSSSCDANLTAVALSFKNNASGRLGPWNMGAMFSWLLQGILLSQTTFYFSTYKNDSGFTRGFITLVAVMNIFKSVMCGSTLWVRSVDKFGDWNGITHGYWPQRTQVLVSELICFTVHIYFILRVFRLTKRNWYLLAFLSCCASLGISGGILFTKLIYQPTDGTHVIRFGTAMIIMLVGLLSCDVTITGTSTTIRVLWRIYSQISFLVFFCLLKSKTGFNSTDSLINRIVRLTWMTAFPPTLCAVLNLAFYIAVPGSDTFVAFNIVLSYLSSISMMYTINCRKVTQSGIVNGSSGNTTSRTNVFTWSGARNRAPVGDEIALGTRSEARIRVQTELHTSIDPRDVAMGISDDTQSFPYGDGKTKDMGL